MNILTFLVSGMIAFLGFNRLKLTSTFLLEKVGETTGRVTDIKWIYGKKGSYIQSVAYEYQVLDRVYSDQFTIGRKQVKRKIGDCLLIKYSLKNPQKNEIIGVHKTNK